jgi:hypothetical protein
MSMGWHTAVTPLVRERSTVQSCPAAPANSAISKASRDSAAFLISAKVQNAAGTRNLHGTPLTHGVPPTFHLRPTPCAARTSGRRPPPAHLPRSRVCTLRERRTASHFGVNQEADLWAA